MVNSLSFWEQNSFYNGIDFAVVGSGIVGLNAAIRLKELAPDSEIAVIERGPIPTGASTRNAGFACFGSMTELLDDLQGRTEEEVFSLVKNRWKGLQKLRQIIGDKNLAYQPFGGFELFREEEEAIFQDCSAQVNRFNAIMREITGHAEVYRVADDKLSNFGFGKVTHLIENQAEGQINTGMMMRALLKKAHAMGIQVLNGLSIGRLEENNNSVELITEAGWGLRVRKVLLATNGFTKKLLPDLDLWPARNQVLITKPIDNLKVKGSFHYDRGYFYFRNVDDPAHPGKSRILLGGGRNLDPATEQTESLANTPLIQNALSQMLEEVIVPGTNVEIDCWWSGILGLGPEKKPILKMLSHHIGAAVRLGGMGVAIGSLLGIEAAEMLYSDQHETPEHIS